MLPPLSIDLHQARPIAPRLLMALLWKFSPSLAGAHYSVPLLLLQKFHQEFTMLQASKSKIDSDPIVSLAGWISHHLTGFVPQESHRQADCATIIND